MRPGRGSFELMLITDPALPRWRDAVDAALALAPPGRLALQVRGAGTPEDLFALAASLLPAARAAGAVLLVNGLLDVAAAVGADGVHLKESGPEVHEARARLGPMALVGASCHDAAGLHRRRDADHVVLGPFNPVPGKGPPLGPERFASLVRDAIPRVLALGGLELSDVASVEAAGASGIAVVRTVLGARDPGRTTLALLDAWQRARHARRAQETT